MDERPLFSLQAILNSEYVLQAVEVAQGKRHERGCFARRGPGGLTITDRWVFLRGTRTVTTM